MIFLRFHSFLNAKAQLIVSDILFFFFCSKEVHCFSFFFKSKYKCMPVWTHITLSSPNTVWLFCYVYWLTQRIKIRYIGAFIFEIRTYVSWPQGEAYFNTMVCLMILGCSDDIWKFTWCLCHLIDIYPCSRAVPRSSPACSALHPIKTLKGLLCHKSGNPSL